MKKLVFVLLLFVCPVGQVSASENQFITIVNPIRIAPYTTDPGGAVSAQYEILEDLGLGATWLMTYDSLSDGESVEVYLSMSDEHELGIWLEVTPALADSAGVKYTDAGAWHFSNNVFLSGYTQSERVQLIDAVFGKFESVFGHYPSSIGSWWTDSYSLLYMQEEYGVTANLGVADQYSTDRYQVWGQYWSVPFIPTKLHTAIPAATEEVSSRVVNMQWAPRGPLEGYTSSLYSTQDYFMSEVGRDIDYFEELVKLYGGKGKNEFGQVVVGLEGDLTPEAYSTTFREQMEIVKKLVDSGEYIAVTMSDFADWYLDKYKISPSSFVESERLDGQGGMVWWYQSPRYRIGISSIDSKTEVLDIRFYDQNFTDPYYLSPNSNFNLLISTPHVHDSFADGERWLIDSGEFLESEFSNGVARISFENGSITLIQDEIDIDLPGMFPEHVVLSPYTDTEPAGSSIFFVDTFDGDYEFRALTEVGTRILGMRRTKLLIGFLVVVCVVLLSRRNSRVKGLFYLVVMSMLSIWWWHSNSQIYFVSQAELDGLYKLSSFPAGKVLVYDQECLGCAWSTPQKPAVYGNRRRYVSKFSNKKVVPGNEVFEAIDGASAKTALRETGAKYIYLARYDEYEEELPLSPGDYGVERIFVNANTDIWKVVE